MKEYINENKKIIIIISTIVLLIIILNIIFGGNKTNKTIINSYIKTLTSNDIDFSLKQNLPCNLDQTFKDNKVPYIKLSNSLYNDINNELIETFLLRACYQNGYISYETGYSDDILSIALNISYETTDDLAYVEYKTYNIDTNNHTLVTNQEILKKYNLNINEINNKVRNYMLNYYTYEKKNNLLDSNIDFNTYLKDINFTNITLNNMKLYIDNKKDLYIFKEYDLSYGMKIDENYPIINIKFKLN